MIGKIHRRVSPGIFGPKRAGAESNPQYKICHLFPCEVDQLAEVELFSASGSVSLAFDSCRARA